MDLQTETKTFSLGQILITRAALHTLHPEDVIASLQRHARSDWGGLCPEDRAENERALKEGNRLFSVYRDRNATRFYIITEHDRSSTSVLLPEDY